MNALRRLTVAVLTCACCVVAAGCGQSTASPAAAAPHTTGKPPVGPPHPRPAAVTGGTAAERRLLRSILAGMPVSQIRAFHIFPAPATWHPVRPGDVELLATGMTPGPVDRRDNERGDWEAHLIGGAFRDRSAALGLPRVLVVGDGSGATRVSPPSERPPSSSPAGAARVRTRVIRQLTRAGFRVAWAQVSTPDGYAIAVGITAAHPGWFLRHRLQALAEVMVGERPDDGVIYTLYSASGAPIYTGGSATRVGEGFGGLLDRRYTGCVQYLPGPSLHPAKSARKPCPA